MAATRVSQFTELASGLALTDVVGIVDVSDTAMSADGSTRKLRADRLLGFLNHVFQARLTLLSGDPHPVADQTAKTSVFITPYQGNRVMLFDGTRWQMYALSEVTLALGTLTADKNYDIFLYDNAGTLTGELSAAWTNDTTRADALTTQDGIDVKSGATTRRWVGTIRTVTTTTTEDSRVKRFVWNAYNRVLRPMWRTDTTVTWTYTTATYRQANASTANQLDVVCGKAGASIMDVYLQGRTTNDTGNVGMSVAIGEDSTTTAHADGVIPRLGSGNSVNETEVLPARLRVAVALGRHYYTWLEQSSAIGITTWTGNGGSQTNQLGLSASYEA